MTKYAKLICTAVFLSVMFVPAAYAGDEKHKSGTHTLQGCLADGTTEGMYVLATKKEAKATDMKAKDVQVKADASFEAHVGHEVKLTGEWKKADDGMDSFVANKVEHVAATCS